ncbi:MAG: OsmC family protein [candidate division KSB1 bacterium]|jgi:putative redox protein|nr:OsmC family protein [candidate division KSB1 bacterium]
MNANIKLVDGMAMVGKGETNHWVPMDGPESLGGFSAGMRPMEMVLLGLGGCTAMDVLSIMRKKRVPFRDFEIKMKADRADDHPKVFTKIEITFIVYGQNIKERDVERAIELSETKYCSASAMLSKTAEIITRYEIVE